jgi:hypothetical protein
MSWLNPYRWLLAGGLIAALVLSYGLWSRHMQGIGYDKATAEYTAAALVASEAARAKESAWQAQLQKAQNEATKRQKTLAADAAALRAERNGLRDQLETAGRQLPGASCGSVREYAATLNAVFDQCSGAIEGLAGKAGGHAADSLMLEQAWPK